MFCLVRLFNNLLENIFQNWIIWSHDWRLDRLETRRAKRDDADARDDYETRHDVEGEGLILQTGNQVHPEHGCDAGSKSDAQTWDFHLQIHFDDFVPGLILQKKIIIKTLCMVDIKLYMFGKDSVRRKMTIDHNNKKESYVWAENICFFFLKHTWIKRHKRVK